MYAGQKVAQPLLGRSIMIERALGCVAQLFDLVDDLQLVGGQIHTPVVPDPPGQTRLHSAPQHQGPATAVLYMDFAPLTLGAARDRLGCAVQDVLFLQILAWDMEAPFFHVDGLVHGLRHVGDGVLGALLLVLGGHGTRRCPGAARAS